ncbi:MAG: methyltransferase domain-containing protein [Pseudomonadota bacterium]
MTESMKEMRLYDQVDRILNELRDQGIDDDAPLSVEDLTPYDQYHYHGTEAVDHAASMMGATPSSEVLEIGSGIGGPSRYLAHSAGSQVTALELQPDLNDLAASLTERCGLSGRVSHFCGNFLDQPFGGRTFDAIMSFLVFLHIPDRKRLFSLCHAALKPGASMVIEDFTKLKEPTPEEAEALRVKVQCSYVPDPQTYQSQLEEAGFEVVSFEDMSVSWTAFTSERLAAFRGRREHNLRVNGEDLTNGLEDFYATAAGLYGAGTIGGARIHARRA